METLKNTNSKNKTGSLLVDNALSKHPTSKKVFLKKCNNEDLENIELKINSPNSNNNFEEILNMGLLLYSDEYTKRLFIKKPLKPICYPEEIKIDTHSVLENGQCYNDKNCSMGLKCEGNYGEYLPGKCVSNKQDFTKIVISSSHPCEKGSDCGIGYKCKEETGIFTNTKKCIKENISSTTNKLIFYGVV